MCHVTCCITKDFGIIATDSALTTKDKTEFNNPKLFYWGQKYLCTGMGVPAYISKLDMNKFSLGLDGLSMYLEDYFKSTREHVRETLKELGDEFDPTLCFFVMGVHKGKPVVAQFNSYLNFKPKFLFSSGNPAFMPIHYDPKEEKKVKMFKETTEYMEGRWNKLKKKGHEVSTGILGEILTRGIFKKADLEMEITGKKSTGGVVQVGAVFANGQAAGLSHAI